MKFLLSVLMTATAFFANAQSANDLSETRKIDFPDVEGYKTLKVDLHQHTVFSDGSVWPNIRVQEAIRDGLDAISITDHIEYQPHLDDIPHPDRNRSYEVALDAAEGSGLLVIRGAEITRDMPPGHGNAIFLKDVNKVNIKDSIEAYSEAQKQGAFNFWNHPHWTSQRSDAVATMTDTHRMLIKEGMLHGIEVVNDVTYSDEALQIALDFNLTILGTSDIHGLIDWQYDIPGGGHRPITLAFAKEKSLDGIKEALMERRTVAWFNNLLVGREEYVTPLINASLEVENASYRRETSLLIVSIRNHSDANYLLENLSPYTFHANGNVVQIAPNEVTNLYVKTLEVKESVDLKFKVLNAVIAPNTNPDITIKVTVN